MPIISDRPTVVRIANTHLASRRCTDRSEAALVALREHYKLCDGEGIWGDSDAAICMDFKGRNATEDLLQEIVESLIPSLVIPKFTTGEPVFVQTLDLIEIWNPATFSWYQPASPGRNELYHFSCPRGTFVVKATDLATSVRTQAEHEAALAETTT